MDEFHKIMHQGFADVYCDECDEGFMVEPDADDIHEGCGGRIVSPLVLEGLI